jgi:probable HAF family extracellular repeat protein
MSVPRFYSPVGRVCALAAILLLSVLAYADPGNGQAVGRVPMYKVTDIGFLPGFINMYPSAINIYGDVVGSAGMQPPYEHAFLYSRGKLADINPGPPPPDFSTYSFATGINAQQKVIGEFVDVGDPHAFIYWNGVPRESDLGAGTTFLTAINDIGQIVGTADIYPPEGGSDTKFAFLEQPNFTFIQLPTLNGSMIHPAVINDLAQIAGDVQYSDANGVLHSDAVITQPGGTNPRDLGNLGGAAYATGVNILGQVVGYSATTNGNTYGVLYSQGEIINLGLPKGETAPQFSSFATGINDFGVIVGYSKSSSDARGLVYVKGQWYDLNDRVNATGKGFTITEAIGINNRGQIVATALDRAGNQHAIILTVVGSNPAKP